eukprot:scaffold81730_cov54-Phaeocystis_antarctica.AAC.1
MHLLMLASLLPAAMAEFEQVNPHPNPNPNPNPNLTLNLTLSTHCPNSVSQCKRASGKWVGFDQGLGSSRAQAVTHSGNNVYVGGYAYASPSPR